MSLLAHVSRGSALVLMTFGAATSLLAQPSIKAGGIVNASGYQATLAPGSVFVIFGSAMGPASIMTATAPSYPASLGGTSITFTPTSGAAVPAQIIYTLAGQVAGLLPSSIAPGAYAVRVIYNTQPSAPQNITVVARSLGIATANSAGSGNAQATIGNVNNGLSLTRFTPGSVAFGGYTWTLSPAHPGDTLVLWGTGGGADAQNDTGGTSGDQTAAGKFVVNVEGTPITPLYAGTASGYPGLWQINFTLPPTIAPNCFAFLQVSAGGQLSNAVTIPIAATGQPSCSAAGFTQATLANLDADSAVTFSGMTVGKTLSYTNGVATETDSVGGPFSSFSAGEWLIPFSGPQVGPCLVLDETYPSGGKEPSGANAYLNAGSSLTISGTGVPQRSVPPVSAPIGPVYIANLPAGTLVNGGTYTLTGAGGAQLGPFTATATMPTSFAVSNLSSLTAINRAQPLTINWTGTGFDQTQILLESDILTAATTHSVNVSCTVPAAPGTFTVPAAALAYLLPGGIGQVVITADISNGGIVTAESTSGLSIAVPLVAGGQIDFGAFAAFIAIVQSAAIQ